MDEQKSLSKIQREAVDFGIHIDDVNDEKRCYEFLVNHESMHAQRVADEWHYDKADREGGYVVVIRTSGTIGAKPQIYDTIPEAQQAALDDFADWLDPVPETIEELDEAVLDEDADYEICWVDFP